MVYLPRFTSVEGTYKLLGPYTYTHLHDLKVTFRENLSTYGVQNWHKPKGEQSEGGGGSLVPY